MQVDLFTKQVRQELAAALDSREDLDEAAKRGGFYGFRENGLVEAGDFNKLVRPDSVLGVEKAGAGRIGKPVP